MAAKDSLARHFSRRLTAAVQGLHLPSEEELLRGMSFFRNELDEDIREYAGRLSGRIRKRGNLALTSLAAALDEPTAEQSEDGVRCLLRSLDGVEEAKGVPVEACWLRCQYYLASFGIRMLRHRLRAKRQRSRYETSTQMMTFEWSGARSVGP